MYDEDMIFYSAPFRTRDDVIKVVKTPIFRAKNLMLKFFLAQKLLPLNPSFKNSSSGDSLCMPCIHSKLTVQILQQPCGIMIAKMGLVRHLAMVEIHIQLIRITRAF